MKKHSVRWAKRQTAIAEKEYAKLRAFLAEEKAAAEQIEAKLWLSGASERRERARTYLEQTINIRFYV